MKLRCQLGNLDGWPETCGLPAVASLYQERPGREYDVCSGHASELDESDLTYFDEGDDVIAEERAERAAERASR